MSKKTELPPSFSGRIADVSWWLFLALSAVTPLFATNTSLFSGHFSAWTLDSITLPKMSLMMVLVGLSLALHFVSVLKGESRLRFSPVVWLAFGFLGWVALSAILSPSHAQAVFGEWGRNEGLAAYVVYVGALLLAVQLLADARRFETWMLVVSTSASVMAVYAFLQYAGLDPLTWPDTGFGTRVVGTMGNPDMLGTYLILPLALALGLTLRAQPRSRRFYITAVETALILGALVLTLVRGAWIGGAVAVLALLLLGSRGEGSRKGRVLWLAAILGGVVVVAGVVTLLAPQAGLSVVERLRSMFTISPQGSIAQRLDVWGVAMRAVAAKPVFGFGPDAFGNAFAALANASWWRTWGHEVLADNAHNLVLQAAVTLGLPGMLLYVASIGAALVASWRTVRSPKGLLPLAVWAGALGLLVAMLSAVTQPAVAIWLWIAAGTLLAPSARTVPLDAKAIRPALAAASALLVVFSAFGLSWLVADQQAAASSVEGNTQGGIAALQRASGINPLNSYYHLARGSLLETSLNSGQGDPKTIGQEIIGEYRIARDINTSDPTAAFQLLFSLNRWDQSFESGKASAPALQQAKEVGAAWPNVPDMATEVARTYLAAADTATAEKYARHAVTLDPRFSRAWQTLSEVLAAQGKRSEAVAAMKRAVALDPQNQELQNELRSLTGAQ